MERLDRFMEPPLTGSFCDLLWADPLLEEVLGYRLSDKDYADVSKKKSDTSMRYLLSEFIY